MGKLKKLRQVGLWIGPLLAALLVTGCAGIEPYKPYDYRQNGPKEGLISGETGEFVIYRKADESAAGSKAGKNRAENADGEQQKTDNEKKKEENKNGEQQP